MPISFAPKRVLHRPRPGASEFVGPFATWEDAVRGSSGYSAALILEKTRDAMRKVRDGEAAFERDSVTFQHQEFVYPLLAGLLRAAALDNRLSVLDFGGALGSSYYQSRPFLAGIDFEWSVVEQRAHVACGQAEFSDEHLQFYETVDACLLARRPNVLLLSGVLQYLKAPYDFISQVIPRGFRSVIIDRLTLGRDGETRLTVQTVPPTIYEASYPCWFLSEQKVLDLFANDYRCVARFGSAVDGPGYAGFCFELKAPS